MSVQQTGEVRTDLDAVRTLAERYKADPASVYTTWFRDSEARTKAFRSIRCGVIEVAEAIEAETFGNDFRGSPLEPVLAAITEQKQVFEGAAHPFYWKPKLRIPDIYENEQNQTAFGRLRRCLPSDSPRTFTGRSSSSMSSGSRRERSSAPSRSRKAPPSTRECCG